MEFRKTKEGESPFPKTPWDEKWKYRMVSDNWQWFWGAFFWAIITIAIVPFLMLEDIIPYTATITTLSLASWSYVEYKEKRFLLAYADHLKHLHYRMAEAKEKGLLDEDECYKIGNDPNYVEIKEHGGLADFSLVISRDQSTQQKKSMHMLSDVIETNPTLRQDIHVRVFNYSQALSIIKSAPTPESPDDSDDTLDEQVDNAWTVQMQSYIRKHLYDALDIHRELAYIAQWWKVVFVGFIWASIFALGYIFYF